MTYTEWKQQEQEKFNALPIFWAFGREQFRKAMEKRGLTEKDTDKLYSLGGGGFYLKSDAEVVRAYFNRRDELPELLQDKEFAVSAFYYEMANHEYHINWQADWDVCSCFCREELEYGDDKTFVDYLKEAGYNSTVIRYYFEARCQFLHDADEKGWY